MTPGTTIALAVLCWTLGSFVLGLLIARAIPASPEPDEHEACAGDPEVLRGVGQSGMINHFHSGSISPKTEQDHA